MTAVLIIVAAIPYVAVGLFVSRAWWRAQTPTEKRNDDIKVAAFMVILIWPVVLALYWISVFARWFYTEPKR